MDSMEGCRHLREYKEEEGVEGYRTIHAWFISPITAKARRKKAEHCYCHNCHSSAGKRLHSCLSCIYFACWGSHMKEHLRSKQHKIWVDLEYGNIWCAACSDYVYDTELKIISEQHLAESYRNLGLGVPYEPWYPSVKELSLLKSNPKRQEFSENSKLGLRGLINLGNTCFMSCIVQVLVHTPLLRNYFLSDRHICTFTGADQCIVCEIDRIFQESFSGQMSPFSPHKLLHMIWTHAHHLAGYEQQDAHEFFIAVLDLLHRHLIHKTNISPNSCTCIVDTIFTGKLQSDLVCQVCKGVSTTVDPFWDISLDLPAVSPELSAGGQTISLQDCLQRFTQPEHLGSAAKIKCSKCNSHQESTKQLTMQKLPVVASFHLKRFEHSSRLHKKITTRVNFPEVLDMTPFISHARNNSPLKKKEYQGIASNNKYILYGVINHIGNLDAGHYTSFIRQHSDLWFHCNDHQILPASIQQVLDSEGYLLFYHKQILEYT